MEIFEIETSSIVTLIIHVALYTWILYRYYKPVTGIKPMQETFIKEAMTRVDEIMTLEETVRLSETDPIVIERMQEIIDVGMTNPSYVKAGVEQLAYAEMKKHILTSTNALLRLISIAQFNVEVLKRNQTASKYMFTSAMIIGTMLFMTNKVVLTLIVIWSHTL